MSRAAAKKNTKLPDDSIDRLLTGRVDEPSRA